MSGSARKRRVLRILTESKINKEALATSGDSLCFAAGCLPTDTSLFLMVDVPEGMVIELGREAIGAGRDNI